MINLNEKVNIHCSIKWLFILLHISVLLAPQSWPSPPRILQWPQPPWPWYLRLATFDKTELRSVGNSQCVQNLLYIFHGFGHFDHVPDWLGTSVLLQGTLKRS